MKSNKPKKQKTNKNIYLAAIGKCSGCHYCVNACPQKAISESVPPIIDHSLCVRCMKCVKACSRNLIKTVE